MTGRPAAGSGGLTSRQEPCQIVPRGKRPPVSGGSDATAGGDGRAYRSGGDNPRRGHARWNALRSPVGGEPGAGGPRPVRTGVADTFVVTGGLARPDWLSTIPGVRAPR